MTDCAYALQRSVAAHSCCVLPQKKISLFCSETQVASHYVCVCAPPTLETLWFHLLPFFSGSTKISISQEACSVFSFLTLQQTCSWLCRALQNATAALHCYIASSIYISWSKATSIGLKKMHVLLSLQFSSQKYSEGEHVAVPCSSNAYTQKICVLSLLWSHLPRARRMRFVLFLPSLETLKLCPCPALRIKLRYFYVVAFSLVLQ